jgi:hypothetical protein
MGKNKIIGVFYFNHELHCNRTQHYFAIYVSRNPGEPWPLDEGFREKSPMIVVCPSKIVKYLVTKALNQ